MTLKSWKSWQIYSWIWFLKTTGKQRHVNTHKILEGRWVYKFLRRRRQFHAHPLQNDHFACTQPTECAVHLRAQQFWLIPHSNRTKMTRSGHINSFLSRKERIKVNPTPQGIVQIFCWRHPSPMTICANICIRYLSMFIWVY